MRAKISTLLLLPLLLIPIIATGQAERTFVKSFNLIGRQAIVLNVGENIQVVPWDNDLVRVQMTINLPTTNDATLKALAESGRYILKNDYTAQQMFLTVPNLQNVAKLNNNSIKELVSYIVFVPRNVEVLRNIDAQGNKIIAKMEP